MRAGTEDHRVLRPAEMNRLAALTLNSHRRSGVDVREIESARTVVVSQVGWIVERVMADKPLSRSRTAKPESAFVDSDV